MIPLVPEDVEIFRASGDVICPVCSLNYYSHPKYSYPYGEGYCIKSCEGYYYHL